MTCNRNVSPSGPMIQVAKDAGIGRFSAGIGGGEANQKPRRGCCWKRTYGESFEAACATSEPNGKGPITRTVAAVNALEAACFTRPHVR